MMKRSLVLVLVLVLAGCGSAGASLIATEAPVTVPVAARVVDTTTVAPVPSTTVTTPTEVVVATPPTVTTTTSTAAPEPEPVVPPLVDGGPGTRELVLSLPVSDIVVNVSHVGDVRVVAWFSENHLAFVFERADGSRALVMGVDRPEWSYVTEIRADPCAYDFFTGGHTCP